MSMNIVSINVPLLVGILLGKSTTCVKRLYVFIKVESFIASLLFVRRLMFRSPQIRKVTVGFKK
jgi:hypothetical protein